DPISKLNRKRFRSLVHEIKITQTKIYLDMKLHKVLHIITFCRKIVAMLYQYHHFDHSFFQMELTLYDGHIQGVLGQGFVVSIQTVSSLYEFFKNKPDQESITIPSDV
ncbi:hypothetical protein ACJX0J_021602, partial [Zea mays]